MGIAQVDKRIKYIKRKNGGPGAARNTGIRNVTDSECGYIFFLDGDDRMKENTLHSVAEKIKTDGAYDLITCSNHIRVDANSHEVKELNLSRPNDYDELKCCLAEDTFLAHYFYKYSKIIENGKFFSEEKKLSEDQEFILNNIYCMNTIAIIDDAFYYHLCGRPNSQVNGVKTGKDKDKIIPTILTWAKMFHDIDVLNYCDKSKAELKHYTSTLFLGWIVHCYFSSDKQMKQQCKKIFKSNANVINNKYNKGRFVVGLSKIFGIGFSLRVYKIIKSLT